MREAQVIIEGWRQHYNNVRLHASLGYKPPAPEVFVPGLAVRPSSSDGSTPSAALPIALRPTLNSHSIRTTRWELVSFLFLSAHFGIAWIIFIEPLWIAEHQNQVRLEIDRCVVDQLGTVL